jgi:hypothetical protein
MGPGVSWLPRRQPLQASSAQYGGMGVEGSCTQGFGTPWGSEDMVDWIADHTGPPHRGFALTLTQVRKG